VQGLRKAPSVVWLSIDEDPPSPDMTQAGWENVQLESVRVQGPGPRPPTLQPASRSARR